jgi:glycosyltransferase involved in cell wall biosynthesis
MNHIRILVDSLADADLINSQMGNAREIMCRLDSARFHVSTFVLGDPDSRLLRRPETRLIRLRQRRQTLRLFREFTAGAHHILFYLKASPASKTYLRLRWKALDRRVVIGMIESQCDVRNEPTIKAESVHLWENTILRSDILFSNSCSVQASLLKEYGRRSDVVPTGVDTKFFTPAWDRPPNQRLRVLFVGSLRPFKGPQLLVRAAARFPAVDFAIAGDGVMYNDLAAQIRDDRLNNVSLLGTLKPPALRDQYRQSDIFFFPSRWEGSPKVILEASACGVPILARKDYQPETVVDGVSGYLAASDQELLERLEELISNADLRRSMGPAARVHSERFDWDSITRRWEEIFLRIVSEDKRSAMKTNTDRSSNR